MIFVCFRSITVAYYGSIRNYTDNVKISWYWLPVLPGMSKVQDFGSSDFENAASSFGGISGFPQLVAQNATPIHTSVLSITNLSQFPSEYVVLNKYTEGQYLFFSQEYDASDSGPLYIGDVVPNFAEMGMSLMHNGCCYDVK